MNGFEEAAELLGSAAEALPEMGEVLHGLAADVRAMPDGGEQADLGRHVDATVNRLEQALGDAGGVGGVAQRDRERRQEEYRRSARSAIADALSEAGFTPLDELRGGE